LIFLVLYCARQIGNQHQPIFADKIWHHLFLWITEPFWFGLLPHCWSLKAGTAGTMLHPCRSWWGTLQPVWQPWKAWIGTTCSAVFVSTGRCLSKPVIYGFDGIHGIPLSTAVFTKNIVSFGPRSDLYIYIYISRCFACRLPAAGRYHQLAPGGGSSHLLSMQQLQLQRHLEVWISKEALLAPDLGRWSWLTSVPFGYVSIAFGSNHYLTSWLRRPSLCWSASWV